MASGEWRSGDVGTDGLYDAAPTSVPVSISAHKYIDRGVALNLAHDWLRSRIPPIAPDDEPRRRSRRILRIDERALSRGPR